MPLGRGTIGLGRADAASSVTMRSACRLLTVRLSRRLIEPFVSNLDDTLATPYVRDSQAMRLLFRYAAIMFSGEPRGGTEAYQVGARHLHDLAALGLGAHRDGTAVASERGVRAARLAAIKADIMANLGDASLSPATVAARQGISPRYVHMLFEGEGVSFAEYVIARRLERAHRMLADPRLAGHTISSIAFLVGFGDLSHFNRTFRRRFGAPPSEVRAVARGRDR